MRRLLIGYFHPFTCLKLMISQKNYKYISRLCSKLQFFVANNKSFRGPQKSSIQTNIFFSAAIKPQLHS